MRDQFAFFGPSERHDVPGGGFCMSAFAIIRKGKEVLLVKPKEHQRWLEEWAPNWRVYEPRQLEAELAAWRFPSSYVKQGGSPEETLSRLMKEQLAVSEREVVSNRLLNFYSASRRFPGKMHWEYCFVYDVSAAQEPPSQPWFSAMEYLDFGSLADGSFGSGQGELARALDLGREPG